MYVYKHAYIRERCISPWVVALLGLSSELVGSYVGRSCGSSLAACFLIFIRIVLFELVNSYVGPFCEWSFAAIPVGREEGVCGIPWGGGNGGDVYIHVCIRICKPVHMHI